MDHHDGGLLASHVSRRAWLAQSGALALSACATSGGATLAGNASAGSSSSLDDLATEIPRLMRLASVPGLSMAVVRSGAVTSRGFGVRRAGAEGEVTADTVFEAASLSKPVFAYGLLSLVAEGVLDLDRPISAYLDLPNAADERAKSITARHLLSHSGGWRNWRSARDQVLTSDFAPGSRFSYSGEGFYFLQRVAEKLTGHGFSAFMRERVLTPLGMRNSGYVWRQDLDAALASPHSNRGQPIDSYNARAGRAFAGMASEAGKALDDWHVEDAERALGHMDAALPVFPNFLVPNAAASLMTTANDYSLFLRHVLGTTGHADSRFRQMLASQVTINESLGWGLGIGLEHLDGRAYFWHWGDNPGFKNFVLGDVAGGWSMVVFTNGNSGARVYERIVRSVSGADHPAFLWI
jgi:CubicO group peptidase (beta-lactamase class C family)